MFDTKNFIIGFILGVALTFTLVGIEPPQMYTSCVIPTLENTDEYNKTNNRTEITMYGDSSTKSYMDYRCITDTTSRQYDYIYNSGEVYICEDGFIRTTDNQDYIGVALGSYFGDYGDRYIFTLDTGVELRVVKIEEKADKDTCDNNYQHRIDGSIIEFVVDTDKMNYAPSTNGLVYNGNFNNNEWLRGNIVKIEKVE